MTREQNELLVEDLASSIFECRIAMEGLEQFVPEIRERYSFDNMRAELWRRLVLAGLDDLLAGKIVNTVFERVEEKEAARALKRAAPAGNA